MKPKRLMLGVRKVSKYTTELRYLQTQGFNFGLTDYPIFDPAYRAALNAKILAHYRYREIGSETPGKFKHYLNTKMNEIMPKYNKLYQSELLVFNPLYNVDYTEESKHIITGESDADTTLNADRIASGTQDNTQTRNLSTEDDGTNDDFTVDSDTPGGMISVGNIKGFTWASKANQQEHANHNLNTQTGTLVDDGANTLNETSESIGNTKTTVSNLDDYSKRVFGNLGTKNYSEMLLDFRATFLNIDMLIINELNECFMGVY